MDVAPLTVIVPTIGRPQQLRDCLESVSRCRPRAAEVLVVDQSGGDAVAEVVRDFAPVGARVVRSAERGVGRARNLGLSEARHDVVLITDDDCTVADDWIRTAWELMARNPCALFTGRVLPEGDPTSVPSTIDDPVARKYTSERVATVLFPNNMACSRAQALALGGFDDRVLFAEDNDFCYRWLRAGYELHYEPGLVVWHHDWRSPEELERLYAAYGEGHGRFYAKHLRTGDLTMLRFLAGDLYAVLRAVAMAAVRGRPRRSDPARHLRLGIVRGLVKGWREFERVRSDGARAPATTSRRAPAARPSSPSRRSEPRSSDRGEPAPPA
jgi:GT2 family glycosyltransferase